MNHEEAVGRPSLRAMLGEEIRTITHGEIKSSIDTLASASITLETNNQPPIDLTAPLRVVADGGSSGPGSTMARRLFTGHARTGRSEPGKLHISASAGSELTETGVGILRHEKLPPFELIHFMARASGMPEDRLAIEGMEDLAVERFLIEQLVVGIRVERPIAGPDTEIVPLDFDSENSDGPFASAMREIVRKWGQPTARIRTRVDAPTLYRAIEVGTAQIGSTLDALLATTTYGLSADPWGRELAFDRDQLRARPSAMPIVFALGSTTGREVLASTEGQNLSTELDVDAAFERWADILRGRPSDELGRALRSLRDAADESRDVFDRCHALSTVLEHYASRSRPPRIVDKQTRKDILAALAAVEMSDIERARINDLVNTANNAPLLAKVRHQVEADHTPVSDAEWNLIAKLRAVRNKTIHGQAPSSDLPDGNRLRWGVSIATRLLLFRWAAESASTID